MATALVTSETFAHHVTAPGHPERPARLNAILAELRRAGLWDRLLHLPPRPATHEELARLHTVEYLRRLEEACHAGREVIDCADSSICHDSWDVALLAAGAGPVAVDAVLDGRAANGFCVVRPPGHHAEADRSMGFCLFNNVALTARHLQAARGLERVLIYDFDVHHGNGTQHLFESDPSVFFCSFHQDPRSLYPGTGFASEAGIGAGEGATLNVTFPAGAGDAEFLAAFDGKLLPAARAFRPGFILVSAGYDAHRDDPLGGLELTDEGYRRLTERITAMAAELCGGRVVMMLEGGYDLRALATGVRSGVEALLATAG